MEPQTDLHFIISFSEWVTCCRRIWLATYSCTFYRYITQTWVSRIPYSYLGVNKRTVMYTTECKKCLLLHKEIFSIIFQFLPILPNKGNRPSSPCLLNSYSSCPIWFCEDRKMSYHPLYVSLILQVCIDSWFITIYSNSMTFSLNIKKKVYFLWLKLNSRKKVNMSYTERVNCSLSLGVSENDVILILLTTEAGYLDLYAWPCVASSLMHSLPQLNSCLLQVEYRANSHALFMRTLRDCRHPAPGRRGQRQSRVYSNHQSLFISPWNVTNI